MTNPSTKNFTVFPIQNQQLWAMYNKQEGSFWRATEVDLSSDMRDWEKLSSKEMQSFMEYVDYVDKIKS